MGPIKVTQTSLVHI